MRWKAALEETGMFSGYKTILAEQLLNVVLSFVTYNTTAQIKMETNQHTKL
jgi:hypothetical protein